MSEATKAVFLSYASQDAEAVRRIADALREAGVEVWFDQNELVGGDAWDAKIRKQIAACALFVPVISSATQARLEGYFRIEWKLAARRTHAMATAKAFLLPIVIDDTRDATAHVPDEFRDVQWTRLPGGETPPAFGARVKKLLEGEGAQTSPPANRPDAGGTPALRPDTAPARRSPRSWLVPALIALVAVVATLSIWRPWHRAQPPSPVPAPAAAARVAPATANPPPPISEARKRVLRGRELLEEYVVDDTRRESLTLAEKLARQATDLDVTDAEAWALSALVSSSYIVTNRDRSTPRRAALIADAERAIKLAPESDEAKFALAAAYRTQPMSGLRSQAEAMLRDLIQRAPADKRFHRMLGNVLRNRQAYAEALEAHGRAAQLPGGDARAWMSQAEIYEAMGKLTEAEEAANRSLAVQPTGAAFLFKVILPATAGDYAKAREALARVPPAVMVDDRGAAVAAYVWLFSREPEKAIEAINSFPGDDFSNMFSMGPKSMLLGFAHQLAGRTEAAQVHWRQTLKALDREAAADPAIATDPLLIGVRMFTGFLVGDPERVAQASQTLRLYVQFGGMGQFPMAWEPVRFFSLLGRQDILFDFFEVALKSGEIPNARFMLLTNPVYDPLRDHPRFEALLADPAPEKTKP